MADASRDFGNLVLLIGDLHIPFRSAGIPEELRKRLTKKPDKISHILCTGNLTTKEELDFFKRLAPKVHVVKGDFDEDSTLPDTKVVEIGAFKVGLIHGHQVVPWGDTEALSVIQRQLDCDILVSGHTHVKSVLEVDGKYLINPGSATGAFSATAKESIPTFILMSVKGDKVDVYAYELIGSEVKITRTELGTSGRAARK